MNLEETVKRGHRAKQVLETDVYIDAWQAYEARLLEELANVDRTEEQAKQLRALLIASRKAKGHLERIMRDGTHAAHELQLIERQSKFRSLFRAA